MLLQLLIPLLSVLLQAAPPAEQVKPLVQVSTKLLAIRRDKVFVIAEPTVITAAGETASFFVGSDDGDEPGVGLMDRHFVGVGLELETALAGEQLTLRVRGRHSSSELGDHRFEGEATLPINGGSAVVVAVDVWKRDPASQPGEDLLLIVVAEPRAVVAAN